MSEEATTIKLPLDELLRDSKRQATSMSLPFAVHHRLDLLAECAAAVKATRAEIVGMLITNSAIDAAHLEQAIVTYRKRTVRDVLPGRSSDSDHNVIELPVRAPGRPRTTPLADSA